MRTPLFLALLVTFAIVPMLAHANETGQSFASEGATSFANEPLDAFANEPAYSLDVR